MFLKLCDNTNIQNSCLHAPVQDVEFERYAYKGLVVTVKQ